MIRSIKVINDEKNCDFLKLLCKDRKIEFDKLSLFERFSLVCDNLGAMGGSRLKKDFLSTLSSDLNWKLKNSVLLDRDSQKVIWRRINGDISAEINIAKTSYQKDINPLLNLRGTKKNAPVLLNLFLETVDTSTRTLEDVIGILAKNSEIVMDFSEFVYRRPDEYHAQLVYEKLASNQGYSSEEISLLYSWIICRTLMQKNANLYFVIHNNVDELKKLLKLLSDRKLYPQISLCFSEISMCTDITEICYGAEEKNISAEIIISAESDTRDILFFIKLLAIELPLTRISMCELFADSVAKEKFYDAADIFIKEEEEI